MTPGRPDQSVVENWTPANTTDRRTRFLKFCRGLLTMDEKGKLSNK